MSDSDAIVAHQFDDIQQQRDAAELGMWVFLATEVLFFGGLLLAYGVYRTAYERTFEEASRHMDLVLGTVNTAVLLTSSLCMALAVQAAQEAKRTALIRLLAGTIVLGVLFLGIKFYEYYHHYEHHLMPLLGLPFKWPGSGAPQAKLFFQLYFLMTGVHALHMIIGIGVLSTLAVLAWRGRLLDERAIPVHVSGLYWHFVDIVWVFLFPFLYLVGARG